MTSRPILFSGPMVRALLDGTKTQTRRVVKLPEQAQEGGAVAMTFEAHTHRFAGVPGSALPYLVGEPWSGEALSCNLIGDLGYHIARCPYGAAGDELWVKETWQHADWTEDGEPWIRYRADDAVRFVAARTIPEADCDRLVDRWATLSEPANVKLDGLAADRVWRPSIFMPRWASRITLTITDVRVQRLQEISDADCMAEGISSAPIERDAVSPHEMYRDLWESINGAESWALNPWVWALTFRAESTNNAERHHA